MGGEKLNNNLGSQDFLRDKTENGEGLPSLERQVGKETIKAVNTSESISGQAYAKSQLYGNVGKNSKGEWDWNTPEMSGQEYAKAQLYGNLGKNKDGEWDWKTPGDKAPAVEVAEVAEAKDDAAKNVSAGENEPAVVVEPVVAEPVVAEAIEPVVDETNPEEDAVKRRTERKAEIDEIIDELENRLKDKDGALSGEEKAKKVEKAADKLQKEYGGWFLGGRMKKKTKTLIAKILLTATIASGVIGLGLSAWQKQNKEVPQEGPKIERDIADYLDNHEQAEKWEKLQDNYAGNFADETGTKANPNKLHSVDFVSGDVLGKVDVKDQKAVKEAIREVASSQVETFAAYNIDLVAEGLGIEELKGLSGSEIEKILEENPEVYKKAVDRFEEILAQAEFHEGTANGVHMNFYMTTSGKGGEQITHENTQLVQTKTNEHGSKVLIMVYEGKEIMKIKKQCAQNLMEIEKVKKVKLDIPVIPDPDPDPDPDNPDGDDPGHDNPTDPDPTNPDRPDHPKEVKDAGAIIKDAGEHVDKQGPGELSDRGTPVNNENVATPQKTIVGASEKIVSSGGGVDTVAAEKVDAAGVNITHAEDVNRTAEEDKAITQQEEANKVAESMESKAEAYERLSDEEVAKIMFGN